MSIFLPNLVTDIHVAVGPGRDGADAGKHRLQGLLAASVLGAVAVVIQAVALGVLSGVDGDLAVGADPAHPVNPARKE